MEPPPFPPSPKLRLMCSYGGHIVPRPHDKSLFYAAGETRLVSVDRRTTAASISALTAHFSRLLFHNLPFHLKYQLPNEDLDSLISVITDEDLSNMIDEHDRIAAPARIRLFLFPVKAESVGSTLLDPKSESWFSDALKSTRILQSADSGLLMGLGSGSETTVETGSKVGAESVVLETSSSFGSTGSTFSLSNSPSIVHCEDNGGLNLLERSIRVPSSASIASENSVGVSALPKTGNSDEPLIQVTSEAPSFLIESESTVSDPSISISAQMTLQVLGYPASQHPDGKQLQHETQLIQGGLHYIPQYPMSPSPQPDGKQLQHETQLIKGGLQYVPQYPVSSMPFSLYYTVYQMPMQQQQPQNQPCPIYLYPVTQTQYPNMPLQCNFIDTNNTSASSRPPLHQTDVITPQIAHKEDFVAQLAAESVAKVFQSIPASTPVVTGNPEPENPSEPITNNLVGCEFVEDSAYNQVYKTQPSPPALASRYQTLTNGITMMLSESVVQLQPNLAKEQAALLPI